MKAPAGDPDFTLTETNEKIIIKSSNFTPGDQLLVINRISNEIKLSADVSEGQEDAIRIIQIGGIIGVINLVACPYLIVIREKIPCGEIQGKLIWQLQHYEIIPFKRTLIHLSEKQARYNNLYLEMLEDVLKTPYFYFSTSYDLSHSLQALDLNSPDFFQQSIVQRADYKFVWNAHMLLPFQKPEYHKFCVALLHGFVSISQFVVNDKVFKFILISRRSCLRPGTRLVCRGVDSEGNVANFVETEQIVEDGNNMTSFVQIRGSIPLYWTQKPNLRYKPKPLITQTSQTDAFTKHFEDLNLRYGKIICINLVNQTGSEGALASAFKDQIAVTELSGVRYEAFDFHHECRKMNYQRLQVLMNRLSSEIEEYGYFLRSVQRQYQEGVFRTNCIDCLDRTNVVQGLLGRINLQHVLEKFNIFHTGDKIENHPDLEFRFKNIWADNGDTVSVQYSGTGALKSDFTRTGKRTFMGLLQDGYNSSIRYLKNNFSDGFRQDAIELFLGHYNVSEKEGSEKISPLEKKRDWKYYSLPALLLFSAVMWASLVILPQEYSSEYLLYILFWGSMTFATGGVIVHYGTEFVDNPVLLEERMLL